MVVSGGVSYIKLQRKVFSMTTELQKNLELQETIERTIKQLIKFKGKQQIKT